MNFDLPNLTALPGLLIALVLGPICALAVLRIMKFMFDGELDLGPGIVGILIVVTVLVLAIMSKSHLVGGIVVVSLISLVAFFPYAVEQSAKAEIRGIDIDKLDRAYREVIEHPNNIASYFALAEVVHSLGLEGHAVMICERTLESLSTEMDPIKNQSLRDVFRTEESRTKQWRRQITDSAEFRAVACPRCGHRNEPGTIACGRCQGPFLLDLARRIDPRQKIRARLVLGFALVAGFITGAAYAGIGIEGDARWLAVGVGLATVAGVLTWLFQPRKLGQR